MNMIQLLLIVGVVLGVLVGVYVFSLLDAGFMQKLLGAFIASAFQFGRDGAPTTE